MYRSKQTKCPFKKLSPALPAHYDCDVSSSAYFHPRPLLEGIIIKRKTQFTIEVSHNGCEYHCHCPTTGNVGDITLDKRPCLLSESTDKNRKTAFTVEAISLNQPSGSQKSWIGINQNAANRYVEHYLKNGSFEAMVGKEQTVLREQVLGNSKLDFLVGNTYLEVKTPLQFLQIDIPPYVKRKNSSPFSSVDRLVKHVKDLTKSLQTHQRAILLLCFLYDNPGFRVAQPSTRYKEVSDLVHGCLQRGLEMWQANFQVTPEAVLLGKYFQIDPSVLG